MDSLLSIEKAADVLGISPWTVRAYIQQGTLFPIHIGRRVVFEESELRRFVKAAKAKAKANAKAKAKIGGSNAR